MSVKGIVSVLPVFAILLSLGVFCGESQLAKRGTYRAPPNGRLERANTRG
jgi:hypothetical protein